MRTHFAAVSASHTPLYANTVDRKSIGGDKTCGRWLNMLKIDMNKVFEHFFSFFQSQEIGDVSTGHGNKKFIPFPIFAIFSHNFPVAKSQSQ